MVLLVLFVENALKELQLLVDIINDMLLVDGRLVGLQNLFEGEEGQELEYFQCSLVVLTQVMAKNKTQPELTLVGTELDQLALGLCESNKVAYLD